MKLAATAENTEKTELLCGLLLEFAGRAPGRMATARRHVAVIDAALPYMTPVQQAEGRRRIKHLETKWGPMLPGAQEELENGGYSTEMRVARWLSTRKQPVRLLRVLHRAANKVAEGESSLSAIMDHAYAKETDHVLFPVLFDSFKEWLVELRIVRSEAKGVYRPGSLCRWWVAEMASSSTISPACRRCLKLSEQLRHPDPETH